MHMGGSGVWSDNHGVCHGLVMSKAAERGGAPCDTSAGRHSKAQKQKGSANWSSPGCPDGIFTRSGRMHILWPNADPKERGQQ